MSKRRNKWLAVTLIVAAWVVPPLCFQNSGIESKSLAQPNDAGGMPGPDPNSLWKYITETNPYREWKSFPGMPNPLRLNEKPHGERLNVYANDTAEAAISAQLKDPKPKADFKAPVGSILVKENYPKGIANPCVSELLSVTVMYKVSGDYHVDSTPPPDPPPANPASNHWFWVMYTPDGRVQIVSTQPWVPEFKDDLGQVLVGQPSFCWKCHDGANGDNDKGLGDYIWNLKPFE